MDELYVGRLNDKISLKTSLTLADGAAAPALCAPWDAALDEPVTLSLSFERCYVDCVEIRFAIKPNITVYQSAVLYCGGRALSRFDAQTGGTCKDDALILNADTVTDSLTVEITPFFSGVDVKEVSVYGATADCPIYPLPDDCRTGERRFLFKTVSGGGIGAAVLTEKYKEITGVTLAEGGEIRFEKDDSLVNDGYRLSVTESGARLYYASERGAVSAAEAFVALCNGDGALECEASLTPALPFRGVHLFLPSMENMDFAKRLIKYFISPLGYNCAIIEVAGGMEYASHPEITEKVREIAKNFREGKGPQLPHGDVAEGRPISREAAADFADYIRSFGIDVVPEIQSLGHVQYITAAHPEIAELAAADKTEMADTRVEDQRPDMLFPHSYCPSNEKSYEIIFDLIDEIIEVFAPREYVHMGHDEVYEIGICPVCAKKDPAELFANDVNRLYAHLREKGLKMMIWSDMIQPTTRYKTVRAADMIPKDVLMLDFIWYFHTGLDIEDNLLEKGFEVAIGNLYSSHYPRYLTRAYKRGMKGGQISTWRATNLADLDEEGKLYDILMTAQMLSSRYDPRLIRFYDRQICARIPFLREKLTGVEYPSLHGGVRTPYDGGEAPAKSVIFTHALTRKATRKPWTHCPDAGKYVVRFTDGTEAVFPLAAGREVGYLRRRAHDPIPHPLYRHSGYTTGFMCDVINGADDRGEPESRYVFEAVLPEGKTVRSVEYVPGGRDPGLVLYSAELCN